MTGKRGRPHAGYSTPEERIDWLYLLAWLWSRGSTTDEIAQEFGVPRGTVGAWISRERAAGANFPRRTRGQAR